MCGDVNACNFSYLAVLTSVCFGEIKHDCVLFAITGGWERECKCAIVQYVQWATNRWFRPYLEEFPKIHQVVCQLCFQLLYQSSVASSEITKWNAISHMYPLTIFGSLFENIPTVYRPKHLIEPVYTGMIMQLKCIFWLILYYILKMNCCFDIFLHVVDALAICYNEFLQFLDSNLANSLILIHVLKTNTQECQSLMNGRM